jgi:hypothetical protein
LNPEAAKYFVATKRKKKRKCEKQVRFMDFFSLLNFSGGFTFVFQKTLQENWYSDTDADQTELTRVLTHKFFQSVIPQKKQRKKDI